MSGPLGSQQWMYATETQPFYPYTIDNSLRFDGSSYLRRLSATSSAIHQFTMSFWVKISDGGSSTSTPYHLMSFQATGSTATAGLCLYDNEITYFFNNSAYASFNPAKARDYSGWYHVVWKNKSDYYADIYVNGVLVGTTVPSFEIINGSAISVGAGTSGNNPFAGGYIADVHFVSGQSLGPDSFGQYDSTGTIWKPKAFSGSHGTDGFHLDFADGTSATTLGYDAAGSNNFTTSSIATSDQMLDSPTNNFATLNPLWPYGGQPLEGNLSTVATSGAMATSTFTIPQSGKWYVEARMNGNTMYGLAVNGVSPGNYPGYNTNGFALYPAQLYYNGPATTVDTGSWANLLGSIHVVGMMLDMDNSKMFYHVDGTWKQYGDPDASGTGYSFPSTIADQDVSIIVRTGGIGNNGGITYVNFGQDATFSGLTSPGTTYSDSNGFGEFMYPVPTDALALCTQNLPDPTFDPAVGASPQDHFSVDLDADGSGALTAAQAVFPTGIWWLKDRTLGSDHLLVDSARGSTLEINPNSTAIESTYSDPSNSSVSWSWKAATTVSGTTTGSGTLKSYSGYANATAGVSVITYEGNGTAGHQIPHHLGAAPSVVVVKNRDYNPGNWMVYHEHIDASPETCNILLNGSSAKTSSVSTWNSTLPSASVVSLGDGPNENRDTDGHVLYAFAEKDGFSKFGVYSGNYNVDGPFVYLGFRPAFVMIKATGGTSGKWAIFDSARDGYNVDNDALHVYPVGSEDTTDQLDLLSNGFKVRVQIGDLNNNAYEYIYMAFAEQPFKYANAR